MRAGNRLNWLALFSVVCLLAGTVLLALELVLFSRTLATLPAGLSLAGVPVGGLTEQQALEQLVLVYNSPVELLYRDQRILVDPPALNFEVETGLMLPEVNQFRGSDNFWTAFWDHLWVNPGPANNVPLRASYSQERLRAFLTDVANRYDRPGSPPKADPGSLGFIPGEPGHALDIEAAINEIDEKLHQPAGREVTLPLLEQTAVRPSLDTLSDLIKADIDLFEFDGVVSVFLTDLSSGRELSIHLSNSAEVEGPIAFAAMSTIKIPIMTAFFAQNEGALTDEQNLLLQRSIDESANTATDLILSIVGTGDGLEGTRQVTADMQRLGLDNTYISGLLDVFGAVLAPVATPANSRSDLTTQPDPYNQTTAEDMGTLLVMIYQCSQGGGPLMVAFPGQFTAQECRTMIDLLTANSVGPIFITGGSSPDGVVAHKHGWDRLPLNNVADSALVFTQGGNYELTIFINRTEEMPFDDANRMIISIARAAYNYFNPAS